MHRHGYQGRKFHRQKDQRQALINGLAINLILKGQIRTTLPKAKTLRPYLEKLITKAKRGDLHNRRLIIASLNHLPAVNKLCDEISPSIQRTSGYLRITKLESRRGDNAAMANISFVDKWTETGDTSVETDKPSVKTIDKEIKPTTKVKANRTSKVSTKKVSIKSKSDKVKA